VDYVLARVLATPPEDRYGNRGEFADALREALDVEPYDSARPGRRPGQARVGGPGRATGNPRRSHPPTGFPQLAMPPPRALAGTRFCRASAIRLRAQRLEVLPNCPASLRSESGLPAWRLAR